MKLAYMQKNTTVPPQILAEKPPAPSTPTPRVMAEVLVSLVPALLLLFFYHGIGLVINLTAAIASALFTEMALTRLRGKDVPATLKDGSAILTAVLLVLVVSPQLPPWWIAIGVALGIFTKQIYGGLGNNLFNPAMTGAALLWLILPVASGRHIWANHMLEISVLALPPSIIAWASVTLALGGLWLLFRRLSSWHAPFTFLVTMALLIGWHGNSTEQISSALIVLVAFYIVTEPVTSPWHPSGRILFASGVAILWFVMAEIAHTAPALPCAVLLMNFATPLINRLPTSKRNRKTR